MICPLCQQSIEGSDRDRYFELDVCRACKSAQIEAPRSGGRAVHVEYRPVVHDGKHKRPARIRVTAEIANVGTAWIKAQRRSWLQRPLELFLGRHCTGDDVLDECVWLRIGKGPRAVELLAYESVRASLLECTIDGVVKIRRNKVTCRREGFDLGYSELNESVRGVLVIAHYLQG